MKIMDCPCGSTEVMVKRPRIDRGSSCGGNNKKYIDCCGRYLDAGEIAFTAEVLMRSRYTAYSLGREDYLLATWYHSTRPTLLELRNGSCNTWLGLEVKRHEQLTLDYAIVEFVARYKVNGRACRLHETSCFVRKMGQWFYVDGDIV